MTFEIINPNETPVVRPPAKKLRELRINPDLANLRYRTFDECKWEDVVFAFEELMEDGTWKNIPTPKLNPDTGCFDFRNCRVSSIQLTDRSVQLLEEKSADVIDLISVWCEDVRWQWPKNDIKFVWDDDGIFSTEPPLSRDVNLDGFWICMFDFHALLYPNMLLRRSFRWCFAREARFSCTILRNVSFRGALLHKTNFRSANLKEANFDACVLWGTDFTGAYMHLTSLQGSGMAEHALFCQGKAPSKNLDGIKHNSTVAEGYEDDGSDLNADFVHCKVPQYSNGYERAMTSGLACYLMAFTRSDSDLRSHLDECEYLLAELQRLKKIPINVGTWREYYDAWMGISKLRDVLQSKRAQQVVHLLLTQDVDVYEADNVKEPPAVAINENTLMNHPGASAEPVRQGPATLWRKMNKAKIKCDLTKPPEKKKQGMFTMVKRCCGGTEQVEAASMDTMTLDKKGKSAKQKVALSDRQKRFNAMVLDTLMLQKKMAKRGDDIPTNVSELRTRAALSAARAVYTTRNDCPIGIITNLQRHVGRVLRSPDYYTIVIVLNDEIRSINRILATRYGLMVMIQSACVAIAIAMCNWGIYHQFPQQVDTRITSIGSPKKSLVENMGGGGSDASQAMAKTKAEIQSKNKEFAEMSGGLPLNWMNTDSQDMTIHNPAMVLNVIALGAQAMMIMLAKEQVKENTAKALAAKAGEAKKKSLPGGGEEGDAAVAAAAAGGVVLAVVGPGGGGDGADGGAPPLEEEA